MEPKLYPNEPRFFRGQSSIDRYLHRLGDNAEYLFRQYPKATIDSSVQKSVQKTFVELAARNYFVSAVDTTMLGGSRMVRLPTFRAPDAYEKHIISTGTLVLAVVSAALEYEKAEHMIKTWCGQANQGEISTGVDDEPWKITGGGMNYMLKENAAKRSTALLDNYDDLMARIHKDHASAFAYPIHRGRLLDAVSSFTSDIESDTRARLYVERLMQPLGLVNMNSVADEPKPIVGRLNKLIGNGTHWHMHTAGDINGGKGIVPAPPPSPRIPKNTSEKPRRGS